MHVVDWSYTLEVVVHLQVEEPYTSGVLSQVIESSSSRHPIFEQQQLFSHLDVCINSFCHLQTLLLTVTCCLLLIDNSMSQSVFRYFNCIEIRGPKWRVVASIPAVDCDGDAYHEYSSFFWILLAVVVIATPIGLLIGLCISNKRRLLNDPKHISRYGVL
jgi:type III secretory pathway component EscS